MRNFQVTVNGKTFDVSVSETDPSTGTVPVETKPAAVPAPKTADEPLSGKEIIIAPMPGRILSLKVKEKQTVQAGDLILFLEAMKMENEIFCGESGIVKEILVREGEEVNPGDVLVIID